MIVENQELMLQVSLEQLIDQKGGSVSNSLLENWHTQGLTSCTSGWLVG